jgi:hypothetical protein
MIADLIAFGISIGLFFITYWSTAYGRDDVSLKSFLYFGWVVYGLLSFPWIIFMVGYVANILTKSKPTAYDK